MKTGIKRPRKKIVMLVDDDQDIRTLFERALSSMEGVKLVGSEDLKAAREIIEEHHVAVAFIDKCLPDGDGVQFCRELVGKVDFPCYVITGSGSSGDCLAALEFGVAEYIPKPIQLQKIRDIVRRHVLVDEADQPVGDPVGNRAITVQPSQPEFHLVGESPAMIDVAGLVQRIAKTDMSTLVVGESGTGKEIIAKQVHQLSRRRDKKFVAVNCAAIPQDLIESELFGHEKGAFTDAKSARIGLFEEAEGGTIFLDEITSTTLDFQVKLLRVLQEGKMRRLGSNSEIELDVRVIAASNKKMDDEIVAGKFREDLYYRLKGAEISLPRLADREKDIMALARHFGDREARRMKKVLYFSRGVVNALERYTWPGNVRELESIIVLAFSSCNETVLLSDLPSSLRDSVEQKSGARLPISVWRTEDVIPVSSLIDHYAVRVLDLFDGNKTKAAEAIGVDRKFFEAAIERAATGRTGKHSYALVGKSKRKDDEVESDESQSKLFEQSAAGVAAEGLTS